MTDDENKLYCYQADLNNNVQTFIGNCKFATEISEN